MVQQSAAVNGLLGRFSLCYARPIPFYERVQKAASIILYEFQFLDFSLSRPMFVKKKKKKKKVYSVSYNFMKLCIIEGSQRLSCGGNELHGDVIQKKKTKMLEASL
jgi:hypothetical protein